MDKANFLCPDESCAMRAGMCAPGTSCTYLANPTEDKGNFDNIGAAAMVILQAATFDGWTRGMFVLMETVASYAWLYYVLIVCIGGFFVVNLFLAVLLQEFLNEQQAEEAGAAADAAEVDEGGQGSGQVAVDGEAGLADVDDADATGARELGALGRFVTSDGFGHLDCAGRHQHDRHVLPYAGMTTEYADNLEHRDGDHGDFHGGDGAQAARRRLRGLLAHGWSRLGGRS